MTVSNTHVRSQRIYMTWLKLMSEMGGTITSIMCIMIAVYKLYNRLMHRRYVVLSTIPRISDTNVLTFGLKNRYFLYKYPCLLLIKNFCTCCKMAETDEEKAEIQKRVKTLETFCMISRDGMDMKSHLRNTMDLSILRHL